jgi:glycosyltransferase involved in cell wall biosynthesis
MNDQPPETSIVISLLNRASTLRRCLDSIIHQTQRSWELIVVDGGSTDGSVEILEQYDAHIAYWESCPDTGIYNAWNKAIARATGTWTYFLGADDYLWDRNVLSRVSKYLSTEPARVVYGSICLLSPDGKVMRKMGDPWAIAGSRFERQMSIPHQGVFHHKGLFADHGRFDENLRIAADYEFLLRELKNGAAYFMEDVVVAGVQAQGASGKLRNALQISRERMLIHDRHHGYMTLWPIVQLVKSAAHECLAKLLGAAGSRRAINLYRRFRHRPRV